MLLALLTTFAASRKEPLATLLKRIHVAIIAAGLGELHIQFVLSDSSVPGGVSSVDRVLKRFPELERFPQQLVPYPGSPETKVISNGANSKASGETLGARRVPHNLLPGRFVFEDETRLRGIIIVDGETSA
jgi:hypothetical protein